MWSCSCTGENCNDNSHDRVSRSPSKSSTCSFPSATFSPCSSTPDPSTKKSMEEVWKDINLACLREDQPTTDVLLAKTTGVPTFPSMIPQNVLTGSFKEDPLIARTTKVSSGGGTDFFNSLGPPPATMLSLNPGSNFQHLESSVLVRPNPQSHLHSHSHGSVGFPPSIPFDASVTSVFPSLCKKRPQGNGDAQAVDRRSKRMIKNRESAARSRARKQEQPLSNLLNSNMFQLANFNDHQILLLFFSPILKFVQAYANELELKLAHLAEENAQLRRQQEKLLADPTRLQKRHTLFRTLTAPF